MNKQQAEPTICFYRLIPAAPSPRRADRSAGGLIPTRALRFCDPVTSATAYGWWVFPPMGFSLMWDGGTGMFWTPADGDSWYPLKTIQFPNFSDYFLQIAPEDLQGFPPPFLLNPIEPGIVQIWSGWLARTRLGWSSLVRSPVNFPRQSGVSYFEGIIETDTWFGPLFINIQLTRTDVPVLISAELPLLQVTPIYRDHYAEEVLSNVRVYAEHEDWTDREWSGYRQTVVLPQIMDRRPAGRHAIAVRKRRRSGE